MPGDAARQRPLPLTASAFTAKAAEVPAKSPAGVSKSVRHIPSLDGIRAVSFMLVFVAHAGLERVVPGGFGVTIFFFLSGFLITTLMRSEFEKTGAVNFRHFWLRRALRILPPFYLVLLAATLLASALYPPDTLYGPAMLAQALHVANYWIIGHGYQGVAPGTGVYWSLAVEEHFYLLFPFLYLAMQKWRLPRSRQAMMFWGLCAAVLAWRCVLVLGMHAGSDRTYLATDTRVDSILFGCALAVWNNPVLDESRHRPNLWKYFVVPAAFAALLACIVYRGPEFRETWRYSIQGAALTFIFIAAMRYHRWPLFRFLNFKPVAFIGVLSYSLYLIHQVLLYAVEALLPQWHPLFRASVALAAALCLAWMLYAFIEKPCARLRARLMDEPRFTGAGERISRAATPHYQ
jgi:peptidoglycan/LPS O-acetylase OafA/YrhL